MTQTPPSISVVLPTHNRADLLPRAVRSVLQQTFENFELLIVDDGSDDDTPEVAVSFEDPRIRLLRRDTPGGAAAARNHGIRRARGELVAFLDDDDAYLTGFLETTARTFAEASPDTGFSWCGARVLRDTEDGERIELEAVWKPSFPSREEAHRAFLMDRKVGTNGGLTVRRRCLEQVGLFDEAYRRGEDTDLLVRLAREYDFVVIPEILIEIHLHAGPRLSVQGREMAAAYERLISKNREALESDARAWFELHYKTAWLYYHGGERRVARRWLRRSLHQGWLRPRAWLAFGLFELLGSRAPRVHRLLSRWLRRGKERRAGQTGRRS